MFILEKNKEGELWLPDNLCRLYNDGFTAYIDFSSHYSYICNKPWSILHLYIFTNFRCYWCKFDPTLHGLPISKNRPFKSFTLFKSFCLYIPNSHTSLQYLFYVQAGSLNIRDYWLILTPISQNYFTYAVSCTLLFCSIPYTVGFLNKLSKTTIKYLLLFLTIGLVGCSALFNKDPFALQNGQSILWIFYLFLMGYGLKEWNWKEKVRYKLPQVFISLIVLFGLIILMTQISLIIRGNTDTALRFSKPYSLFAMYYTFSSFLFLEMLSDKLGIKGRGNFLAVFLIVTQVICNFPLVSYRVSTFMKREFPNSGKAWLINIGQFFICYLLAVSLLVIFLFYIQKIRFIHRFIEYFAFDSIEQLTQRWKKEFIGFLFIKVIF